MITERLFEDIICKYPELIEEGLVFQGRQISVHGKIMDVLFRDRFKDKLIVKLKVGPIDRKHIGQVMEYEGGVLSVEEPTTRIMLIGNRVPPNLKKALDHHGIEWREITLSALKQFLTDKKDTELLKCFDEVEDGAIKIKAEESPLQERFRPIYQGRSIIQPALFTPVEGRWIDDAIEYFKSGKDRLYFYTNASIGQISQLNVKHVYFKAKGDDCISVQADFIESREDNPVQYRLPGAEDKTGRYYYGYRNMKRLDNPVSLENLKYYKTGSALRNDVPGPCIIFDPFPHTSRSFRKPAFLLGADKWEKMDYHMDLLAKGAKYVVWRIKTPVSEKLVEGISFPINLYFFKQGQIKYKAVLDKVGFEPAPLEYVPEINRGLDYPAKAFFWLSKLEPLVETIPFNGLRKWKDPSTVLERSYGGSYFIICDPFDEGIYTGSEGAEN